MLLYVSSARHANVLAVDYLSLNDDLSVRIRELNRIRQKIQENLQVPIVIP